MKNSQKIRISYARIWCGDADSITRQSRNQMHNKELKLKIKC